MTRKRMRRGAVLAIVGALVLGAMPAMAMPTIMTADDEATTLDQEAEDALMELLEDGWLVYDDSGECELSEDDGADGEPTPLPGSTEGEEETTDGTESDERMAPEVPEGCPEPIDVMGPNGQVNHGTVVSSFVKWLKDSDYDGPLGHRIRDLAKSDLGKGDDQVKPSDDDTDDEETEAAELEESDGDGPPAHAKARGRDKAKEKKGSDD